jgi:hypothetical protein
LSAELAHRSGGVENVFAGQKTAHVRYASGNATEHQGAMRDRFVARNGRSAAQRTGSARFLRSGCAGTVHFQAQKSL